MSRVRSACLRTLLGWSSLLLASGPVFGLERRVETRIVNADGAPVIVEAASTQLVQTYGRSNQFPLASVGQQEIRVARSRVKYINQLNQQVPTFLLQGEVHIENDTRRDVVALQLTTVSFNAFQERLAIDRHTITDAVGPLKSETVRWSHTLSQPDIFELYVAITGVRFKDGTVWSADEELIFVP